MRPKRPIELVNASIACSQAWAKRDAMIDAGDKIGVLAMDYACDFLTERYNQIYREWQAIGGTSNISTIALFDPRTADQADSDIHAAEWDETIRDVLGGL